MHDGREAGAMESFRNLVKSTRVHELRLAASIGNCEQARAFVRHVAERMNFPPLELFQLDLAVDEGFVNAADHGAYCASDAEVEIRLIEDHDRLTILIRDFGGRPFNPTFFERMADHRTMGVGGRGIKIIKEIMDEVMYIFAEGRSTTLYMSKLKNSSEEDDGNGDQE